MCCRMIFCFSPKTFIDSDHDFEQVDSCDDDYLRTNIEGGEDKEFDSL
jgi:hypothetical protein